MNIRTLVAVPIVAICGITIVLMAAIGNTVRIDAADNFRAGAALEILQALLATQETLSDERAPGPDPAASDPPLEHKLPAVRARTDRRLAEAIAMIAARPDMAASQLDVPALRRIARDLAAAREVVDAQSREPAQQRELSNVDEAAARMVALIPGLAMPINRAVAAAVAGNPLLMAPVTIARLSGDLFDYAGQIGSMFNAPLSKRRKFNESQILRFQELQGHVNELHRQLGSHERLDGSRLDTLSDAEAELRRRYFGDARLLLNHVIADGLGYGRFDVTATQFETAYGPAIRSILKLRDAALALAHAEVDDASRLQRWRLAVIAAIGGVVPAIVFGALLLLRRRVIDPLVTMAGAVVRLANGEREVEVPVGPGGGEIASLARAIGKLRETAIAADSTAEQHRSAHALQLDRLQRVYLCLETARAEVDALVTVADAAAIHLRDTVARLAEQAEATNGGRALLTDIAEALTARCELVRDAVGSLIATSEGIGQAIGMALTDGAIEAARQAAVTDALNHLAAELLEHAARIGATIGELNRISLTRVAEALPRLREDVTGHGQATLRQLVDRTTDDAQASGSAFARLRHAVLDLRQAILAVTLHTASSSAAVPASGSAQAA